MRHGQIPMSSLPLHHGPGSKKALRILFQHLAETDRPVHVSTAITNSLETALRRSRGLHSEGALSLTDIFVSLARLFDPYRLGCSSKIFKQMESFFLIHSEEILTGHNNLAIGFQFIASLDYMSFNGRARPWDMTPVLACLVRAWDQMGVRPSSTRGLPPLSSNSKRILKELALQSDHKRRRRHLIPSPLACPCPCNVQCRPALSHRPHSHHGDFRPSAAIVPGQAFCPKDLLQFCLDYPELIDIRLPGSGSMYEGGLMGDGMSIPGGEEAIFLEAGDPYGFFDMGMYVDADEHLGLLWPEQGFVPRHERPRLN